MTRSEHLAHTPAVVRSLLILTLLLTPRVWGDRQLEYNAAFEATSDKDAIEHLLAAAAETGTVSWGLSLPLHVGTDMPHLVKTRELAEKASAEIKRLARKGKHDDAVTLYAAVRQLAVDAQSPPCITTGLTGYNLARAGDIAIASGLSDFSDAQLTRLAKEIDARPLSEPTPLLAAEFEALASTLELDEAALRPLLRQIRPQLEELVFAKDRKRLAQAARELSTIAIEALTASDQDLAQAMLVYEGTLDQSDKVLSMMGPGVERFDVIMSLYQHRDRLLPLSIDYLLRGQKPADPRFKRVEVRGGFRMHVVSVPSRQGDLPPMETVVLQIGTFGQDERGRR